MEDTNLTDTESRYFSDLFLCCDTDKTGKIPSLKATELFRSANLSNDVIQEITNLAGVPQTGLYLSRKQFYSCLKLIAAYQASVPLREEIITLTIQLPLPRFSWKESPTSSSSSSQQSSTTLTPDSTDALHSLSTERNGVVDSSDFDNTKKFLRWPNTSTSSSIAGTASTASSVTLVKSPDLIELARETQSDNMTNSDQPSTDSEVEQNEASGEKRERSKVVGGGSPEAWSTASDSPTPTNSIAERPWAKDALWHGLLCEEQRQLLGTEEESSDKHSSDEDAQDIDFETFYEISQEQKQYYIIQFQALQPDLKGLLSGHLARVFFEKSRIPVEELRHIWQLCDVTRDGALSLSEFTAAMHLVVLRRNNIPIPPVLPAPLQRLLKLPKGQMENKNETAEGNLLNLESDDTDSKPLLDIVVDKESNYKRIVSHPESLKYNQKSSSSARSPNNKKVANDESPPTKSPTKMKQAAEQNPHHPHHQNSVTSPSSGASVANAVGGHKHSKEWNTTNKEWTKFTESPTSNVSSPGLKPVNFDLQRTAQAVVSDPQILHPVPLRVTPVGGLEAVNEDDSSRHLLRKADSLVYDSGVVICPSSTAAIVHDVDSSPKSQIILHHQQQQRDSLPNDLRPIQRPQPKKVTSKGALPPPPQRESSFNEGIGETSGISNSINASGIKKDMQPVPPPLPPPRPHRHARSSSLDLNKLKLNANIPIKSELPRISPGIQPMSSHDGCYTDTTNNSNEEDDDSNDNNKTGIKVAASTAGTAKGTISSSGGPTSFADFTHFPESNAVLENHVTTIQLDAANNIPQPMPRSNLTNTLIGQSSLQNRSSAFEVYRKPILSRNSQSQSPETQSSARSAAVEYEKRVTAITDNLRQVKFKNDQNIYDVLKHLKEQNQLLLRLCNDLNDELLNVQQKKGEIKIKLECYTNNHNNNNNMNNNNNIISNSTTTTSTILSPLGTGNHSNI